MKYIADTIAIDVRKRLYKFVRYESVSSSYNLYNVHPLGRTVGRATASLLYTIKEGTKDVLWSSQKHPMHHKHSIREIV